MAERSLGERAVLARSLTDQFATGSLPQTEVDPPEDAPAQPEEDAELKWRRKQKHGKIMKPSTFAKIKKAAAASGASDPGAVAGAAYWRTVTAKHRKARAKKGK